jgi:hypothetical protein
MSDGLREAARRALAKIGEDGGEGDVQRLTLDVLIGGKSELVTLSLRAGELAWSSTGTADGPHVRAALRWLAGTRSSEPGLGVRVTQETEPRATWAPGDGTEGEAAQARARLADAIDDVVTVVVRAGAGEADSPSIAESLERLRREAPLPTPIGLARWLGRLKSSLDAKDVGEIARLLDGAAMLAEDLRREKPSPSARRRVVGWMGAALSELVGAVDRLSDRTLVEVAREQLASSERGGIERRHLVDLHNGEVFREERTRTTPVASVGPCPRLVTVGLAEVEEGAAPRRIRLMQYSVSLALEQGDLAKVGANAYRRFSALADRYRDLIDEHPGQAEPFAVVAPRRWSSEGPTCYDDEGDPLAFAHAEDPAATAVLARAVPESGPRWVAGRLVDSEGVLMMVPCAVAVPDDEGTRMIRLR